jgi:hypothetical protein
VGKKGWEIVKVIKKENCEQHTNVAFKKEIKKTQSRTEIVVEVGKRSQSL